MSGQQLWHFTCDHGRRALGDEGHVIPMAVLRPDLADLGPGRFAWFTDLAFPLRDALGLTSTILACDRTEYRYEVLDPSHVVPWTEVRRQNPDLLDLERAPGARPRHWFISSYPVPVHHAPMRAAS